MRHNNYSSICRVIVLTIIVTALSATAKTYRYGKKVITPSQKCIIVDGNPDRENSMWVFPTFNEAMEHITDGTPEEPMNVYIAPWVYWIDDPDDPEVKVGVDGREPFGLIVKCQNLHITGLGADPRETVLAAARGQTQGAVGNFTMLDFWGDGLEVRNLTMGNFCNVDLDYTYRPELSRKRRMPTITQAHVAYCHGDKALAEDVRFIGRLNLNPINGARRMLYNRCHLEMTDDALTGNGVYLSCDFDFYGQRPLWNSHTNGAVFLDCDFNICHSTPRTFFCKSVGQISLVDCRFHAGRPLYVGWTNTPPDWLRSYQYNVTIDDQQYFVGADNISNTIDLTPLPLLGAYRVGNGKSMVYNTYNLLRGEDGWDPLYVKDAVESLSQREIDYSHMPTSLIATPREATVTAGSDTLWVTAEAFFHNGYPAPDSPLQWQLQSGHESDAVIFPDGNRCGVVAIRDTDGDASCVLTATSPTGLQCATALTIQPSELPPPVFIYGPFIEICDGGACLVYLTDSGKRADMSDITWSRSKRPDGSDAIPVAVTHDSIPTRCYSLSLADVGYYLVADICPKHIRSTYDPKTRCVTKAPIRKDVFTPKNSISTEFYDFSTFVQPKIIPGFWTVDCHKPIDTAEYDWTPDPTKEAWVYGKGFNGAKGYGLLQQQKGARLMYTPLPGKYGDMEVELLVDPTKTAGQGFGSATGQYMDICLKFDPKTLTGYGLRIERTVKSGHAVDFSLVRYDNGIVTPLTDPITAGCYLTGCHINVKTIGNRLSATVYTDTPVTPAEGIARDVSLETEIESNSYGGFALQHTGSCGESTTMLHNLRITWTPISE